MNLLVVWLRVACFFVLAAIPIVLTLRWRSRILSVQGTAGGGWFAFQRATSWLSAAFWFIWIGAVLLLNPWRELAEVLDLPRLAGLALHNAMTVLPPALLLATCDVINYPVMRQVRGLELPKNEVVRDAFFGRLWLTLPAVFLWTGFLGVPPRGMAREHAILTMGFTAAGVLSLVLIQVFWLRRRVSQTFTPHSVTMGPLRDRIFALAEKAGVKLNQIYVFPMAKWRLANAYASEGNNLMLTDWLLRHLNTREVDAVVGHELAHMKQGHVPKLTWIAVLLWIAPIAWLRMRHTFPDLAWTAIWLLGSWQLAAWISASLSRRYERQADLKGITISGDPEAFISGLLRIDQLNVMPHDLGALEENLSTHPSTRKRIESIRKAAGLSEDSIEAAKTRVAATEGYALPEVNPSDPLTHPSRVDGYQLPESVEAAVRGDAPVFDSTFKHAGSHRFTMLYVLVIGLTPVGIAKLLIQLPDTTARLAIGAVGALIYAGLILFVMDVGARSGLRKLQSKIAARLLKDNNLIAPDLAFIGLSPGERIRTYEGSEHWDLGFLFLDGDRLCYVGEQTRFALRRKQICAIRVGLGVPNWLPSRFVYVDWSDAETNSSGTFNVACVRTNSFWGDGRKSAQLAARVQEWLDSTEPSVESEQGLPLPQFSEVTSKPITGSFRRSQFTASGFVVLVPGVMVMIMTGMLREDLTLCVLAALGAFAGHTIAAIPSWRYGES